MWGSADDHILFLSGIDLFFEPVPTFANPGQTWGTPKRKMSARHERFTSRGEVVHPPSRYVMQFYQSSVSDRFAKPFLARASLLRRVKGGIPCFPHQLLPQLD